MKTNTQKFISKININGLLSTSQNIVDQDGDIDEKLFITVPFDGYHDAISEVQALTNVIEVLALNSCVTETENLQLIASVAKIIQKIIPDLLFLDNVIFDDPNSKNNNFKLIEKFF